MLCLCSATGVTAKWLRPAYAAERRRQRHGRRDCDAARSPDLRTRPSIARSVGAGVVTVPSVLRHVRPLEHDHHLVVAPDGPSIPAVPAAMAIRLPVQKAQPLVPLAFDLIV